MSSVRPLEPGTNFFLDSIDLELDYEPFDLDLDETFNRIFDINADETVEPEPISEQLSPISSSSSSSIVQELSDLRLTDFPPVSSHSEDLPPISELSIEDPSLLCDVSTTNRSYVLQPLALKNSLIKRSKVAVNTFNRVSNSRPKHQPDPAVQKYRSILPKPRFQRCVSLADNQNRDTINKLRQIIKWDIKAYKKVYDECQQSKSRNRESILGLDIRSAKIKAISGKLKAIDKNLRNCFFVNTNKVSYQKINEKRSILHKELKEKISEANEFAFIKAYCQYLHPEKKTSCRVCYKFPTVFYAKAVKVPTDPRRKPVAIFPRSSA